MSTITNFRYLEPLYLRRDLHGVGALFVVDKHYTAVFDKDGSTVEFTVPAETRTDLASIPAIVPKWIAQKVDSHIEAAVVHDFLCVSHLWTSKIAADIFEEGMRAAGVGAVKRKIMANAVRWFGPKWD